MVRPKGKNLSKLYEQYLAFRATLQFPEPYQREDTATHTARKERAAAGDSTRTAYAPRREGWRKKEVKR